MSFKTNDCQQITFNDVLWGLTDREKRMLEKSWAKPFAERIFPLIDESKFSCLYSDKASRPNTPVNICVGALILKELFNMTDEEMVDSLVFDVRFQYALHTTGFEEQPLSDKTLNRFRRRCYTYELKHGTGWKDWNITTIRPITTVSSTTSAAAVMRKDCRKS